ncbi:MAG: alpha-1,3-galactosidase B, partial [Chitinophaga rupis]
MKLTIIVRQLFCSFALSLAFIGAYAQDTIRITDLGYRPNSRANAVAIVKQALVLCKTKTNPVLVFAPGRYDFWPQYSDEKLYYESNTDV